MKRWLVIGVVLLSAPAQAEQVDLSTQTCKAFIESGQDEIRTTLAWLDGYYKEEDDPAVIDTDLLVANAKKLGVFCAKNPSLGLITAADKILSK